MILAARATYVRYIGHSKEWLFCLSLLVSLVLLCVLPACSSRPEAVQLAGGTMGTTWHVTYIAPDNGFSRQAVQQGIEERLAEVNQSMSTYLPDSEISQFNAAAVATDYVVSADFFEVLATAVEIGGQTHGAYDVTVAPLVDLWGFGPAGAIQQAPAIIEIQAALAHTGQHNLRLDAAKVSLRKESEVSLDFSSLAKGFAVDKVARWLQTEGVTDYLVEVGGEMKLAGNSARGDLWQIAIEQPDVAVRSVAAALRLTDMAMATSGDYRNFFEVDGKRFSHTLDPRTGYPVNHDLVSVTVVHPSAMVADAWATALTVLGGEEAMLLAEASALAVYFIREIEGEFIHSHTSSLAPFLAELEP